MLFYSHTIFIYLHGGMKMYITKKRIIKTVCALLLLCAATLGAAACTIVLPGGNPAPGTNADGTPQTTPSAPNEQNNSKYSALLNSVINDKYYNALISNADRFNVDQPVYDPHPYAFLEDQGIDVDKIKNGEYEAYTMSFVFDDKPNELNIHTRVLINDEYYESFLITYKLSKQEMEEYQKLHGHSYNDYSKYAFFLNDKISETKQPINIEQTQLTKKTQEDFTKYVNEYQIPKDVFIPKVNLNDKTHEFYLYTHHTDKDLGSQNLQVRVGLTKNDNIRLENNAYYIPNASKNGTLITKEDKTAQGFFLQEAYLTNSLDIKESTLNLFFQ